VIYKNRKKNKRCLFPYLSGEDMTSNPASVSEQMGYQLFDVGQLSETLLLTATQAPSS